MAVIHRCDQCRREANPHPEGGVTDGWFSVWRWGGEQMIFCSEGCVADYFLAKRMIEGAM